MRGNLSQPLISVIIPVFNQAEFLGDAIQSVLDQTHQDFEIIVVNDGSSDGIEEVVQQFSDTRIQYIEHAENRGLPAARNTGIRASSGELIACLDADDWFHPRKLEVYVSFLEANPEIGLSYNSTIFTDSRGNPLTVRRAPSEVGLADLVLAYHLHSNIVVRRKWAVLVGLYDESFKLNSEDLNFHLRLALAGCRFSGIESVLSYRRLHSGRFYKDIDLKVETYLRALETAFSDPRCPPEVVALRNQAYASHYITWAYQAAVQGNTRLAHRYFLNSVQLKPSLASEGSKHLAEYFVFASMRDGGDHETALRKVFTQLPACLSWMQRQLEWAVSRGYSARGVREVLWGRCDEGKTLLAQAKRREARVDEKQLRGLVEQLLAYEMVIGDATTNEVVKRISIELDGIGTKADIRFLNGCYWLNRAFISYRRKNYSKVPRHVMAAVLYYPPFGRNKGALSIFLRSIIYRFSGKYQVPHPA